MAQDDAPVDVYVAAYADSDAAEADWDFIRGLVEAKVLSVKALVLIRRDKHGRIHIKDDAHDASRVPRSARWAGPSSG
jgi:hypothetical protein